MDTTFFQRLRIFDAYSKAKDEVQTKTLCGAAVTIVSGIIMVLLFFSELRLYTNQEPLHQLAVDQSRSDGMIVYIDIALHDVKCSDVTVDIGDSRGNPYSGSRVDVTRTNWLPPKLRRQARKAGLDVQTLSKEDAPGCLVKGELSVRKMAGVINIRGAPTRMGLSGQVLGQTSPPANFTHKFRQIAFGRTFHNGPLDGITAGNGQGPALYKYFVNIVPTDLHYSSVTYNSSQYSVTEFAEKSEFDPQTGAYTPSGIMIKMDVSPIKVVINYDSTSSFLSFLTSVCAIVGGIFTVAGMVDSTVYKSAEMLKKQD